MMDRKSDIFPSSPGDAVLIVEDEDSIRLSLTEFMELKGLGVRAVENGHAGLAALEDAAFKLCVVDLLMPGMGGEEFMRRVLEIQPDMIFVVVTGKGMAFEEEYRKVSASSGVAAVLQKPFALEKLYEVVMENLARRPS